MESVCQGAKKVAEAGHPNDDPENLAPVGINK